MVKSNADVSWKAGESKGYMGIVVRNSRKMCLNVRRNEVLTLSAIVAEAIVVLQGCLLVQQCNYSQIMVESDCKHIMSCLNRSLENCNWEIYPILSRILQTRCLFQNCV